MGVTRRQFLATAMVSAVAQTPTQRPNVLVFMTDQQRWDTMGCYGNPMELTPNFDRMASEGVRFERAFTMQPVCAPARSSIQTGNYPTKTGVVRNGIALRQSDVTLPKLFEKSGYDTGYVGKWHLSDRGSGAVPVEERGGYNQYWVGANALELISTPYEGTLWDADNRPLPWHDRYRVDVLTDYAVEFIDRKRSKPFFLFVSNLEPHFQNSTNTFIAPRGYADRYRNDFYIPPDLAPFPGDWKSQLPEYYGIIKRIDENFGRIMTALESAGIADNTIVAFVTDHGCHFRTRNAEYKRSCHDASVRLPVLMRGPRLGRGVTVSQLVSTVDFAPSLLDAAGIEPPGAMQGRSWMPLVRGDASGWRNEVYIQMREEALGRAIRTERWKYCVYDPDAREPRQPYSRRYVERHLYDLDSDPNEIINLAGRKDYRAVADQLRQRLIARAVEAGEPAPEIVPARYYS